jgi:peptidyl-prolyl cis-trans isomerase SurA
VTHAARFGLAFALLVTPLPVGADEELVDGIAAQVGGDIVLVSEVLQMVEPMERRMREAGAPETEIAKVRAEGLERMIEWRLIEKVVRDAELFATEAEIDETIQSIAGENGLTPQQLRESVESHGLGYDDYRAQIKRELERRKVLNAMVRSQVRIDEKEVRDLYLERYGNQPLGGQQLHLRQVLVAFDGDSGRTREAACALVETTSARLSKGDSFESVASELSRVPGVQGGDLGWLMEENLAGWMHELVDGLAPGQTSQATNLPYACTLLQLVERREYTPVTFEMAQEQLTEEVFRRKMETEYDAWLEQLRGGTFIERRGYFADAARLSRPTLFEGVGEAQGGGGGEAVPGS